MAVYVLSVKPMKMIGDCLIPMMFLKSVSSLSSKFSAGLSLRGATEWPCGFGWGSWISAVTCQKRWELQNRRMSQVGRDL